MAYDGELVKMENGRWARFQRMRIHGNGQSASDSTRILVAVELDEEMQVVLRAAEDSLERYRVSATLSDESTSSTADGLPEFPGDLGALH